MINLERLVEIDHQWQAIERSYRIETYNAPTNLLEEKKQMLAAYEVQDSYNPQFEYLTPPEFPIQQIHQFIRSLHADESALEKMYYTIAHNELLTIQSVLTHSPSLITGCTSLIYGIPDTDLIQLAKSTLVLPLDDKGANESPNEISAEVAATEMNSILKKLGFQDWVASPFSPLSAKMMVSRLDKMIKIREGATFSQADIHRLMVHEIGVHVTRAENGSKQPLEIFSRGLPGYLDTEEGLAVYSEEQAQLIDNVTIRKYAARVIAAVASLSLSFNDVFYKIAPDIGPDSAFEVVSRAKRGFKDTTQPGAHTKDIVYLKGFRDVSYHLKQHPKDYELLFVGKIGLSDLALAKDLVNQGILNQPSSMPSILFQ